MRDKQVAVAVAVVVVLALSLGFWLLFLRPQDDTKRSSGRALTPLYPPASSTVTPGSDAIAGTDASSTGSTIDGGANVTSAPGAPTSASVTDPVGDLTLSADPAPPWADLAGATLTRSVAGYELRVKLGGGSVPTTTDAEHTMNIASFYDVDGDGFVDYEVWANLASGGWGTSYFDNESGTGAFQENSGATIATEGDVVVVRFPVGHLAGTSAFRWSVASEWGRYPLIGTDAMARDDAPDNDAPAGFPG